MTAAEFRSLALALPEVSESSHGGHPDFRVAGRVFASLGVPDDEWGMVALTPEAQAEQLAQFPGTVRPAAGAWGRRGYTCLLLASVEASTVQNALFLAHATAMGKKSRKS